MCSICDKSVIEEDTVECRVGACTNVMHIDCCRPSVGGKAFIFCGGNCCKTAAVPESASTSALAGTGSPSDVRAIVTAEPSDGAGAGASLLEPGYAADASCSPKKKRKVEASAISVFLAQGHSKTPAWWGYQGLEYHPPEDGGEPSLSTRTAHLPQLKSCVHFRIDTDARFEVDAAEPSKFWMVVNSEGQLRVESTAASLLIRTQVEEALSSAEFVSWPVCCLNRPEFSVALSAITTGRAAKRAIATELGVPHFAFELFIEGEEDPLLDDMRLSAADLAPLFVLLHEWWLLQAGTNSGPWRWTASGSAIVLRRRQRERGLFPDEPSEEGMAATKPQYPWRYHLVTGGSPMTEGRHYWEVEYRLSRKESMFGRYPKGGPGIMVGAVQPCLDHEGDHSVRNDAYFIDGQNGGLYGHGKRNADQQGGWGSHSYRDLYWFACGDRVGVLLDLDEGWMRFYHTGKRYGPGFTEGVTGPLVRAGQIVRKGSQLAIVPGAGVPEGAGVADEPWGAPDAAAAAAADE
jgi:hypothetical protein